MTYCSSCNVDEPSHFIERFGTFLCKYEDIREVLWLAKIRNEEGDLR